MNINNFLEPGKSTNVIAAAGTGKTWFIISKILDFFLRISNQTRLQQLHLQKKQHQK